MLIDDDQLHVLTTTAGFGLLTVNDMFGYIICLNVGNGLNCATAYQPLMFSARPGLSSLLAGTKKKARTREIPIIATCNQSMLRQLV